jgi:gamma-glutamyl hercynylcysteine S-oxide synthase
VTEVPEDEREVTIPAGPFLMGRPDGDLFADPREQPARVVVVPAFAIDVHPTSNRRYREFVAAGGYLDEALWSPDGWRWAQRSGVTAPLSFDSEQLAGDDQPVGGVSWYEAQAFATWAGRRLPTSAEWEKAARGEDGRTFPWGDALPHSGLCNFNNKRNTTAPLGTYPDGASPYGLHDMAGNVNNWVQDVYWAEFGRWCAAGNHDQAPLLDLGLAKTLGVDSGERVDRGGGYLTHFSRFEVLSTTYPLGWPPESRQPWHGFRTARSL